MDYKSCLLLVATLFITINLNAQIHFGTEEGKIQFKSDAPLELIQAVSNEMKGIIDTDQKAFAFSVEMKSFQGFNSPLQRVHFNENYLETNKYPKATFSGKIIETIDWNTDGTYEVRSKGKLLVHGLEQERIIRATLKIADGMIQLRSVFTVLLDEHQISIPKIMFQKISEEIEVIIEADLEKQSL
ncbi:MAG: YceI family protein [Saprospiraceae bacterium]|nr:YceI family protein [Saprospiraceae bacterium]